MWCYVVGRGKLQRDVILQRLRNNNFSLALVNNSGPLDSVPSISFDRPCFRMVPVMYAEA